LNFAACDPGILFGCVMQKHVFECRDLAPRELGSKEIHVERIDGAVFDGFVFCRVGGFDIGVAVGDPGSFSGFNFCEGFGLARDSCQ